MEVLAGPKIFRNFVLKLFVFQGLYSYLWQQSPRILQQCQSTEHFPYIVLKHITLVLLDHVSPGERIS